VQHPSSLYDRKLGVAVVGLGVGEQHALAYAAHSGCDLRWLFDASVDTAEAVRARVGTGAIASSFDTLCADPDVSIISIASYDDDHFDQVVKALHAGKHVFVEKPLCRTGAELEAVRQAWHAGGKPHLASNLVLRAAPLYLWLKAQVESGAFGDIYAIDGDYLYGRLTKITEGWRKDVDDYSVMEGGGIHLIDLMMLVAGERPNRVHTVGNRIATAGSDFQYDDFQAATFTFPSGLVGRISANFSCVHRHHHVLRVFGTKASFIYDDAGARLHTTRDEGTRAVAISEPPLPRGKGVLIPAFVEAIQCGADSTFGARREFDLVSVCAQSDQSHAERCELEIRTLEP